MKNMATGWIKISRDIQTHWIYQDPEKLKWWLDLLLLANFEDKEFNIKFKVFQCKRGQLLYSLKSLSQRWNVSKSVVNNFLELLRKQNMIETENETVTTRITICNYDIYQQIENANNTETKRKRNGKQTQCDTTKEYKEVKELKEIKEINKDKPIIFNFKKSLLDLGIEKSVVSDWLIVRKNKRGSNTETAFNDIKLEIEKSGISANECIKYAVVKNWAGFNADWAKDYKPKQPISEMTHQQLKKHLWDNHFIQIDDINCLSFEQLMSNYKSGKYPKKP